MNYRYYILSLCICLYACITSAQENNSDIATEQYNTAIKHFINNDYKKCLEITNKELKTLKDDTAYCETTEKFMILNAKCHYRLRNSEGAVTMTRNILDYHAKHIGTTDLQYAFYLDNLSMYLINSKEIDDTTINEAKTVNSQAEELIKKINDKCYDLGVVYMHAADIYTVTEEYDKVIDYMKKVLDNFEYNYGIHSQNYIDELKFLKDTYDKCGNDMRSMQLSGEIAKLTQEAQDGYVPENIEVNGPTAARDRKEDMRMCCKYYLTHHLNDSAMANAGAFIISWSKISDEVTVLIKEEFTTKKFPFIIAYIAGYVYKSLENLSQNNNFQNFTQGYISMLNFYVNNKAQYNISEYDEYINLYEKDHDLFFKKLEDEYKVFTQLNTSKQKN